MGRLDGKRALVTGGSRGIGRAVALRLAAEGASVAVNYNSGEAEAEAVAEEVRSLGVEAAVLQASVADAAQAEGLVTAAIDALGGLDVLVNNAGITRDNLLMRLSEEDWDAGAGHEPEGSVPVHEGGSAPHAAAALRTDHQHVVGRRDKRATRGRRTTRRRRRGSSASRRPSPGRWRRGASP